MTASICSRGAPGRMMIIMILFSSCWDKACPDPDLVIKGDRKGRPDN
jgi:hypothetical protein